MFTQFVLLLISVLKPWKIGSCLYLEIDTGAIIELQTLNINPQWQNHICIQETGLLYCSSNGYSNECEEINLPFFVHEIFVIAVLKRFIKDWYESPRSTKFTPSVQHTHKNGVKSCYLDVFYTQMDTLILICKITDLIWFPFTTTLARWTPFATHAEPPTTHNHISPTYTYSSS